MLGVFTALPAALPMFSAICRPIFMDGFPDGVAGNAQPWPHLRDPGRPGTLGELEAFLTSTAKLSENPTRFSTSFCGALVLAGRSFREASAAARVNALQIMKERHAQRPGCEEYLLVEFGRDDDVPAVSGHAWNGPKELPPG
ncbi:hypothetical protein B0T26DRAFT_676252 [Lasiosphaeria miniovina]|uniref:Uncharacterized protein n=1 Tax=Lasiosphaeria miniovina TaxID=1954250 RepID=A0AA40ALF7_9PEZI|nr:uncharacterized protein B0T26DRAFT_676252 [Lasiosphaeria miniovina]KAK0718030.1 hypothetical protein B0T26DRAFT_676252 [Lasiosphaeria miniovina]